MILYTITPSVINDLLKRLKIEAEAESKSDIILIIDSIGTVTWYNLVFNLNVVKNVIKSFQEGLVDGDLQDLIDELGEIAFYDLFHKIVLLIKATELVEQLLLNNKWK